MLSARRTSGPAEPPPPRLPAMVMLLFITMPTGTSTVHAGCMYITSLFTAEFISDMSSLPSCCGVLGELSGLLGNRFLLPPCIILLYPEPPPVGDWLSQYDIGTSYADLAALGIRAWLSSSFLQAGRSIQSRTVVMHRCVTFVIRFSVFIWFSRVVIATVSGFLRPGSCSGAGSRKYL